MSLFQNLAPFMVAALVILTGVIGVICARVELRLAARKKVTLSNYKQKSSLFYITKDKPMAVLAVAAAGLTVAVFALCISDPVLRIYAIALGLLLPVDAVVAFLALTRHKCARDVRLFDAYYVQVENVLSRKERTLAEINVCRNRINELRSRLAQTIHEFNANLAVGIAGDFLPELFAPVDRMITEYLDEIGRFSAAVEWNFKSAMHQFLTMGTVPEFETIPLRTFDEATVDDLLAEIKSSYGGRIAGIVVEQVDQGAVKSAKSLSNIMALLHKLEVKVDGETLTRFLAAAARFKDRAELMDLLYRNQQIPLAMVREVFIVQDWEWTFVPTMAQTYNQRELTAILTDVLAADRLAMCYRLLSRFSDTKADVLQAAIDAEVQRANGAENATTRLARAYYLILTTTYAVGNSGNIYENLGYMLFDRREELGFTPEEVQSINSVVANEAFYVTRGDMAALYAKASAAGAPMVDSTTRVLLQYIMEAPADFLDPKRLATLFGEYRVTLSFADLNTMRMLLGAWILLKSENNDSKNIVLGELVRLPVADVDPRTDSAKVVARKLLTHLTQNDRVRLRSVIYRTESDRLTLDRVLAL